MNYTFLYCLFCLIFCAACVSQSLRDKRAVYNCVNPLVVSRWVFLWTFAIFLALILFLPALVLAILQKLLVTFSLTEAHLTVLSMFLSQVLTAVFVCTIRRYLKSGCMEYSFKQSLFFGLQKFGCVLPLVLLVSIVWLSILLILKKSGLNISLDEQSIVALFSQTEGVFFRIVFCILAVFIAPFIEEYVFRAGVYRVLKSSIDPRWAAVCTSGLFAIMHFNLVSSVPLFILSQCLIKYYERSGSIGVPIVIHGMFNLNSVILMMLTMNMP